MSQINLRIIGCRFAVEFDCPQACDAISLGYSAFITDAECQPSGVTRVGITTERAGGWNLQIGSSRIHCPSIADLIYDFEKELTLRIQLQRRELLFVHGAALAADGECIVVTGESGAGKSTLCWTLCNEGYDYMSDELAPVDPATRAVEAYPHALCLKKRPSQSYELPAGLFDAGRTMHIPVQRMPGRPVRGSRPLSALFFVDKSSKEDGAESVTRISAGQAAARLYVNSLNQLAHDRAGLAAVLSIIEGIPAYTISRSEPRQMATDIRHNLAKNQMVA